MERNKILLFFILLFTLISTILGLFTITSKSNKQSKIQTQKIMKEGVGAVLIRIEGEIHSGKSTYSSTGADTVLSKIREVSEKPDIKGILLEINSPGGTVAASQEIFEELLSLRKEKKIVVSMKDLAASGGYYIASAADYIYAEPGTITGSIGVITMSPDLTGLMEKMNVRMNVYKAGKYKDILSMFREATSEEEGIINDLLSDTYKRFLSDISRGRNLALNKVEKAAEGKIYSGERAIKMQLVDAIGGRKEALEKLSELCGQEGQLQLFEEEESPFDRMLHLFNNKLTGITNHLPMHSEIYKSPVLLVLPSALRF
ncbi:MAG: signal peptide peptidase SppA [Leptospiraceae bacterium]|nr:signal peptide peptidase SppA [Leptospiraceae bacterium]MCP5512331.1 signal peptide peptidase SppA [Leptospiraceae bacterium]